MRQLIAKLDAGGVRAARWFALLGLVGLVALALMTIVDVLMRWLLNSPIDGVADVSKLIVAIVIASFFPLALTERRHITIEFLGNALGRRARAWLETLAALVTTVFFTLLAWQFVKYTIDLNENQETTWLLGIPVAPWWAVATIFMLICVPLQIVVLIATYRSAREGGTERVDGPGQH